MNILTEDVVGYSIRFLDLITSARLAISSTFFLSGFVWSNVKYFDGQGLIQTYSYNQWQWLDEKAHQFARSLRTLEHLELDSMIGRHFLPLVQAKAHQLKTLIVHSSFAADSERPLHDALRVANPATLTRLHLDFGFENYGACDAFVEIYKGRTSSPLADLTILVSSKEKIQNVFRQIAASTGSLQKLTLITYIPLPNLHSNTAFREACQRNASTLRMLSFHPYYSEGVSAFESLIPNLILFVQRRAWNELDVLMRKAYVVGLRGVAVREHSTLYSYLLGAKRIQTGSDELFNIIHPLSDVASISAAVHDLTSAVWSIGALSDDADHTIWIASTYRKIVDLAIASGSADLQQTVFQAICWSTNGLDQHYGWLMTPLIKKMVEQDRSFLRQLAAVPSVLASLLADSAWVKEIDFKLSDYHGTSLIFQLSQKPGTFNTLLSLPGFDPSIEIVDENSTARDKFTLVEWVLNSSHAHPFDVRVVPLLKTLHRRFDLLWSIIKNEKCRAAVFRQQEYLLAVIKAFDDGIEHLAHPDLLWYFLAGGGKTLETLRIGLQELYLDAKDDYENVVLPLISDGLWTAAISMQSRPSLLCLQLCTARAYFPNVPDWTARLLNDDSSPLPIVPTLEPAVVKEIIRKVLPL